ncbi:MAG: glycosyltransferase [Acidobacteriota bacterium]
MRRLLLISPHFPPDGSAGTHRARVLAPALAEVGWTPLVLTVDARDYETDLDDELAQMVPATVEVERCRALPAAWTRAIGIGDLGLRALPGLWRAARRRLARERFDAVYITTYPVYPALLGPWIKRRFGMPFVLDVQDPWTGAWGLTVGGGPGGEPDVRSRLSRRAALALERRVLPWADALTGVSAALLDELRARYPVLQTRPAAAVPIGLDLADVHWAAARPRALPWLPASPGTFTLCAVGTVVPLALDVLRTVLTGAARLRASHPALAALLRLIFVGTSNQARADAAARVRPLADSLGVADLVHEHPPRVPFADALRTLLSASAVLVLGSSEARYTASKMAPAVASGRPLLVVAHPESEMHRRAVTLDGASVRAVACPSATAADDVSAVLADWIRQRPAARPVGAAALDGLAAPDLARRVAAVLDAVVPACR